METDRRPGIKQIICYNIIAAGKVAGDVCQGLAVKPAKAFIYDSRDADAGEIPYIGRQCGIASEPGLTEAGNNGTNNITVNLIQGGEIYESSRIRPCIH